MKHLVYIWPIFESNNLHVQGFQFTFQRGGGMVPPLRGGAQGGGFGQEGGGMPRETSQQ